MASTRKSIANIQILRGLAAISVVIAHAAAQFPAAGVIPRVAAAQAGVDVFFVISGFIMVYVTSSREQSGVEFLKNRIIRIVPNYWFYTFLTAATAFFAPSVFRGTAFGLRHLILSLIFIAHRNPALADSTSPLLRPGWTINYEMFFYLIFSIALLRHKYRVAITTAIIACLVLIGAFIPHDNLTLAFYTRDIMLEFAFGMLLAVAYLKGLPKLPAIVPILVFFASVGAMIASANVAEDTSAIRSVFLGIPALAIVTSGLILQGYETKFGAGFLTKLGDASYSVYLSHPFAVTGSRVIVEKLHLAPHGIPGQIAFLLFTLVMAATIGMLAYRLIETPLIKVGKRFLMREKPKVPQAV